jgi:hypothetical protein
VFIPATPNKAHPAHQRYFERPIMTNPTQLIEQLVAALNHLYKEHWMHWNSPDQNCAQAALTTARAHLEQPTKPDCAGGLPCTTCADKQACATGCVRMGEFVGSPAPSTAGERDRTIVSLPIPASASDLKSDIAELIQSHKYKGLRSIEVLGVFQFLGAEIISGSNS